MGGDIAYAPRPGGGAVFGFTLDISVAGAAAQASGPRLDGRRILVVAPAGAEPPILARSLTEAGASARRVESASQAAGLVGAAAAAALPYHAVLVDQRALPDAGTVLLRIREAAGVPLSAAVLIEPGRRGEIEALRGNGFDAYVVRPVRRSSLLRITAAII